MQQFGDTALFSQLGFVVDDNGETHLPTDWSFIAPDRPAQQCKGICGRILPDLCFRPERRTSIVVPRSKCVVCEQERNDAYKREHRYEIRARNVLNAHKRKERKQGLHGALTLVEYERLTGVTVVWLANEMEYTYDRADGVCYHCKVRWSEMPNGLSDMSVDRIDRTRLLSPTNLILMCRTGNSQKGTKDPRTWDVRQAYWRLVVEERRAAAA